MRSAALLAAVLALVVAGCGSNNKNAASSSSGGATATPGGGGGAGAQASGGVLKLSAPSDGSLKFDQTSATAKAGKLKVEFDNKSSAVPHAVEIEGNGVEKKTKTVTGGTASVTVDLKPGKYEFYCPVDSHKQAGMTGTLTVQ